MSITTRVMNDEALRTAIRVLAPVQAENIEFLYRLLDDAQRKGYEQAHNDFEALYEIDQDNAYDEGYLQGVDDARRSPSKADSVVADILAEMQNEAFEAETNGPGEDTVKHNAHVEGADWDLDNLGYTASSDEEALQAAWQAYDRQVFRA